MKKSSVDKSKKKKRKIKREMPFFLVQERDSIFKYLKRKGYSFDEIGMIFGYMPRSTVHALYEKIERKKHDLL